MKLWRCENLLLLLSLLVTDTAVGFSSKPYVGRVKTSAAEFVVVGTSHYRCQSAEEVKAVIEEEKPDGVLVELDPERLVRLTKEYALKSPDQDFGADFLSAIQVAQDNDIPLFLGDEYTQATKARFLSTLLTPETYNPSRLLTALFPKETPQIDLIQTFLQDPRKAIPLAISLGFPLFLFFVLVGLKKEVQPSPVDFVDNQLEVVFSILLSGMLSSKVFNALIADRDDILAERSINAAQVIQSLKQNTSIRKTWQFTVDSDHDHSPPVSKDKNLIPLFTLKTPLRAGATRNLNLFEPRWLAMIDSLEGNPPQFGCVSCINKFYSVVKTPDGHEGRYADVIFKRTGRMAKIGGTPGRQQTVRCAQSQYENCRRTRRIPLDGS